MDAPGRTRQRLKELAGEIPALLECALRRSPLWRGKVYDAKRKCGKPNCRCTRGELHVSPVLTDRSGDRLRNRGVPPGHLALFRRMTEDYRKVRQVRARFLKITKEMLSLLDRLEEGRRREAVKRHGGKLPPLGRRGETS